MATTVTQKRLYISQPATGGTTCYTVPTSTSTIVKNILLCNTTSSDATITVNIVPSGGSASASNRILSTYIVKASDTVAIDLTQVMSTGDFIYATNTTSSAITMTISGVEVV